MPRWTHFRELMDLFCTAYLDRGGWGNGWDEPPGEALLEIAEECFRAGYEEGGRCGAHAAEVLRRAGRSAPECEEVEARVINVLEIAQAVLSHRGTPARRLDWQRSLPLHEACAPATDPRWSRPAVRREFPSGIVAYLCATEAEWRDRFGDSFARWPAGDAMKWCHRADGPALILSYSEGGVWEEYWFWHGRRHRADGPQRTIFDRDGTVLEERWAEDDVVVRELKHAARKPLVRT